MCNGIGPIQMVADGKNDVPSHPVGADDVNYVRLLYRHTTTAAFLQAIKKRSAARRYLLPRLPRLLEFLNSQNYFANKNGSLAATNSTGTSLTNVFNHSAQYSIPGCSL